MPQSMLKLARWLRTVQQNCSTSLPTTFCSYKRTISLANFTCEGCGFWPISKLDRKATPAEYDAMGRMAFMWNSVVWPPRSIVLAQIYIQIYVCLRSNLIAPKFQNFSWGACPQAPLGYVFLRTHYQPDHSKSDGYGPAVLNASVAHLAATQYVASELRLGLTGKFSPSGKTPTFIYFQLEARYSEHLEWENHSAWVLSWRWEFSSLPHCRLLNGSLLHYQGSREEPDMSWLHNL